MDWSFKLNYASLSGSPAGSRVALNHIEPLHYHSIFAGEGTADLSPFPPVLASNYNDSIVFPDFHST
jgi:hypothetical protein